MLWLDKLHWLTDYLSVLLVNAQIFQLMLVFSIGLLTGGLTHVFIYAFPLLLKKRWHSECYLYLNYSGNSHFNTVGHLNLVRVRCCDCKGINRSEKIPLLSWLMCRGHCCECGQSLTYFYPLVEFFTAFVITLAYWRFNSPELLLPALIMIYLLVAMMFIDFRHLILPDELTLLLLWLGLIFNLNHTFITINDAILGAVLGYLALWGFYWLVKLVSGVEGLGYGDFKLLAALGAWFGWQVLHEIILLASVTALLSVVIVYVYKDKTILKQPQPFGSYLSLAGLVMLLQPTLFTLFY